MKIALDQSVELEFNEWNLDQAAKHLSDVRYKAGNRADDIFRGMLTILLFGHIEQQAPGTIAKLSSKRLGHCPLDCGVRLQVTR